MLPKWRNFTRLELAALFIFGVMVLIFAIALWGPVKSSTPIVTTAPDQGTCLWRATAKAWIDTNQNGTWDVNESPLPGVKFFIDDVLHDHQNIGPSESISDSRGQADIYVFWSPDCPGMALEIYAEPPSGYRMTTQSRIRSSSSSEGGLPTREGGTYSFGFASVTP